MRHILSSLVAAGVTLAAACSTQAAPASNPHDVPEPQGLYQGSKHGYTPKTLTGGTVLDADALAKLIKDEHPVLIDVSDVDRKPPGMSEGMIWAPQHISISGAHWLPGAGNGTSDATFVADFRSRTDALTGGHKAQPIVVFCHPDCWSSYNAAKRLIELGYTKVYWYPEGIEGWQVDHYNDMAVVKANEAWVADYPKSLTQ